jgi:hypothetical protein
MKQVLDQTQQVHYVDDCDMIRFIESNSTMKWNDICDFVRKHDITSGEYGPAFWKKQDVIDTPEEYNEEQVKWITTFFEAHPWIESMMVVFDS